MNLHKFCLLFVAFLAATVWQSASAQLSAASMPRVEPRRTGTVTIVRGQQPAEESRPPIMSALFPFKLGKSKAAEMTDPFLQHGLEEQQRLAAQLTGKMDQISTLPQNRPQNQNMPVPERQYPWPAPVDSTQPGVASPLTKSVQTLGPPAFLPPTAASSLNHPSESYPATGAPPVQPTNLPTADSVPVVAAGRINETIRSGRSNSSLGSNSNYARSGFFNPEHRPNYDDAFRPAGSGDSSRRGWRQGQQPAAAAVAQASGEQPPPGQVAAAVAEVPITEAGSSNAPSTVRPAVANLEYGGGTITATQAVSPLSPQTESVPPVTAGSTTVSATPATPGEPVTKPPTANPSAELPDISSAWQPSVPAASQSSATGPGAAPVQHAIPSSPPAGAPSSQERRSAVRPDIASAWQPPAPAASQASANGPAAASAQHVIPSSPPAGAPSSQEPRSAVREDRFSNLDIEQDIWGKSLRQAVPGTPVPGNSPPRGSGRAGHPAGTAPPVGPAQDDASRLYTEPLSPAVQPPSAAPPNRTAEAEQVPLWGVPDGNVPAPGEVGVEDEASRVLAVVGDQSILAGDLLWQINILLAPYEGKAPPEQLEQQKQLLMAQMLPRVIENKLVYMDFLRTIPRDRLPELQEQVAKEFKKSKLPGLLKEGGVTTAKDLDAKLRKSGSSLLKQQQLFLEQAVGQQMVQQNVKTSDEMTHEKLLRYYYAHSQDYEFPARARWERLMVRWSEFASKDDARVALAAMGNEILRGAPFDEVARRDSQGPQAPAGGVYDWTTEGSLKSKPLNRAIFGIPKDRLSRIIEDEDGASIIRVIQRTPAGRKAFDDVQDEIKLAIRKEEFQNQVVAYLDRLKKETRVWSFFDDGGKPTQIAAPPPETSRR